MELWYGIPIALWIVVPILICGLILYYFTRNKAYAIQFTVIVIIAVLTGNALYHYESYLHNHFYGTFDAQGLPTIFSHTGLSLLLDTWILWLVPTLIGMAISIGLTVMWFKSHPYTVKEVIGTTREPEELPMPQAPADLSTTSSDVAKQLEVNKLKKQLDATKQKYQDVRTKQSEVRKDVRELQEKIVLLIKQMENKDKENAALNERIQQLDSDLAHAHNVIENMVHERDSGQAEEEEGSEEEGDLKDK